MSTLDKVQREYREEGKRIVKSLSDAVNVMGFQDFVIEGMIEEFQRTHPTLQQGIGRVIIELIQHGAEQYELGHYDLRNEAWCKLCSDFSALMEKDGGAFLPSV